MPTTNPFPLNIPTKQDTWSRLQLLGNIAPEYKLVASEFNKIIQALNYLHENIGGNGSGVTVDKEKITVGIGVTSIQLTDSTPPKAVWIHEEGAFLPEGTGENEYYTYNASTGLISFKTGLNIPSGTNFYITKIF